MIVTNKQGRRYSQKTKEERAAEVAQILSALKPEEAQVVCNMLDELDFVVSGADVGFDSMEEIYSYLSTWHDVASSHYEDRIVSAREFVLEEEFLGDMGRYLYPKWLEDLIEFYDGEYEEALITGSIGSGKTTWAELAVIYQFYQLCMLKDPQATYGLIPGSEIILICFNRDQSLARDVTYGGVKVKIEQSPFFQSLPLYIGPTGLRHKKKNIWIRPVSAGSAGALGRNVFGGIIDETDFLRGSTLRDSGSKSGERDFAEVLYESVMRRMRSRFDRAGKLPGRLILSSSARHVGSFTNRRMASEVANPKVFVRDYAIYDVKPESYFSKKKFYVLVGAGTVRHQLFEEKEELDKLGAGWVEAMEEKGCKLLEVPSNFFPQFKANIEDSIRDICGVVTAAISPYFQVRERIHECIDNTLFHPLETETWVTGTSPAIKWNKLVKRARRRVAPGQYEEFWQPRRHPDAPRHVHFDFSLGKQDAAGLVIAHVADTIEVLRNDIDGRQIAEEVPLIEVDLLLRVEAQPGMEIDLASMRGLVYAFMERGFSFSNASADQFQSAETLQQLRYHGVASEKLSVDKTTVPYDYLKAAIYEGRVSYYRYKILLDELEQLQKNSVVNKVEHLPSGSKDVADALAAVVYTLSTKKVERGQVSLGISETESEEDNSEWIRATMSRRGDVPVRPEGDTPVGGAPVITMG